MISVRALTKHDGGVRAVDDLTFDVEAGKVTGFLGPNGAGKSTTMRMVMGLDRPTSGTVTVKGRPYAELAEPLREVGALLDAGAMHRGRTGRAHLRIGARSHGIPLSRVDEVIDQVGLGRAAGRRIKGCSLGMRQRLGIAAELLGDPPVLLFDEPVNGLDLDGVRWIRARLRGALPDLRGGPARGDDHHVGPRHPDGVGRGRHAGRWPAAAALRPRPMTSRQTRSAPRRSRP
jgi:ABC-2 type transport system ATP-binding protein